MSTHLAFGFNTIIYLFNLKQKQENLQQLESGVWRGIKDSGKESWKQEVKTERCVVLWAESTLNWLLSELWIRPGLNTFTLKGLSVPYEGNLLQKHTSP